MLPGWVVLAPRVPEALYVHKPQFAMEMYGKYFINRITDGRFITQHNHIVVYCACCVPALRDVGKLANVFDNAMISFVILICVTTHNVILGYVHSICLFLFACVSNSAYVCLCVICTFYVNATTWQDCSHTAAILILH